MTVEQLTVHITFNVVGMNFTDDEPVDLDTLEWLLERAEILKLTAE